MDTTRLEQMRAEAEGEMSRIDDDRAFNRLGSRWEPRRRRLRQERAVWEQLMEAIDVAIDEAEDIEL